MKFSCKIEEILLVRRVVVIKIQEENYYPFMIKEDGHKQEDEDLDYKIFTDTYGNIIPISKIDMKK